MKKIFIIIACVIFFGCSIALADEVDDGLPQSATKSVRASVRSMIRMGIDSDDAMEITRLMLQTRFREEHILRAHQIVMETSEKELPVEPITSKVNEGIAKQVKAETILQAMEKVRSRFASAYDQARMITQERSQIRMLANTIAACMVAGVEEQDMKGIMNQLQERIHTMDHAQALELSEESLKTTRDMARLGLSSRDTADLISLALENQSTVREMVTMRNTFMTKSGTVSPAQVANEYTHSFKGGQNTEDQDSKTGGGSDHSGGTDSSGSSDAGSGGSGSGGHGGGGGSGSGSGN
ncbi:MAG: hypothetical protein JRI95_06340 [Deltaproteobacteria bacterium]|nr:hypothetical protein [Deltaproteobacteria bacterium]